MLKRPKTARYVLFALTFLCSLALFSCSNHAVLEGPAPSLSFKTLKSETPLKLDELGKPLLVSFWSTTCVVCVKEMPHLAEVYREFQPKGFEMVAVAMPFDKPSAVLEMSEAQKWPFLVALDMDKQVTEAFGEIKVTPTAFLIDQNGDVVENYIGAMDLKAFRSTLAAMTGG